MKLNVSAEEAKSRISSIPHKACIKAAHDHWLVSPDGSIRAQAVLWLFCWAKTGMNSEAARAKAAQVFDEIVPISFAAMDCKIPHEYARKNRYSSDDIEQDFESRIGQLLSTTNSGTTHAQPTDLFV